MRQSGCWHLPARLAWVKNKKLTLGDAGKIAKGKLMTVLVS